MISQIIVKNKNPHRAVQSHSERLSFYPQFVSKTRKAPYRGAKSAARIPKFGQKAADSPRTYPLF